MASVPTSSLDATDNNSSSSSSSNEVLPWRISVKTVGGGFNNITATTNNNNNNNNTSSDDNDPIDTLNNPSKPSSSTSSSAETEFTVRVSPEDTLHALYDQIEATTGLKPNQQRLIYRGRLIGGQTTAATTTSTSTTTTTTTRSATSTSSSITTMPQESSSSNNNKIKDIAGLADGQTIHLVKKRETPPSSETADSNRAINDPTSNSDDSLSSPLLGSSTSTNRESGSILGGGLLAALLGLSLEEGIRNGGNAENTGGTSLATSRIARASRLAGSNSRSRRPHYRLTAQDLSVPDPGSMEPVRQGLMTLNTMIPHLSADIETPRMTTPVEANRQWYQGQWIDCRDTVNQWLEATIVEILQPEDVLRPYSSTEFSFADALPAEDNESARRTHHIHRRREPIVTDDPAVSASDLDGRRNLLLEACDPDDPRSLGGELSEFRPRSNNDGVQLLLIHYNGWPHRWDEWIRSDSERIRPFRSRTRHPSMSPTALPTPQSVFHEAPPTNIVPDGDESDDRAVLLPELAQVMASVNNMLQHIVARQTSGQQHQRHNHLERNNDLPWTAVPSQREESEAAPVAPLGHGSDFSNILIPFDEDDQPESRELEDYCQPSPLTAETMPNQPRNYTRRELQDLSTLLDRLGRTLTDAAPHIASLAASLPQEPSDLETTRPAALASTQVSTNATTSSTSSEGSSASSSLNFLSLLSSSSSRETSDETAAALSSLSSSHAAPTVNPDHVDYVSGIVNTTRGEVRSGPRSSSSSRQSSDDVGNLLGAYLAAASLGSLGSSSSTNDGEQDNSPSLGLGQLLRASTGGGNGGSGGIDIHIHAVVTAPGMGPGGIGVATLGGGGGGGSGILSGLGGGSTNGIGSGGGSGTTAAAHATTGTSSGASRSMRRILRASRSSPSRNDAFPVASRSLVEEDTGLFSELYSETPEPVDPNGSPDQRPGQSRSLFPESTRAESDMEFLRRLNGAIDRDVPSPQRRRYSRSSFHHRETTRASASPTSSNNISTSNSGGSSSRRSFSGWGRLFRRRRSTRDPSEGDL